MSGKFYLGDAGFGLSSTIVTPYGRTRYHLKEYSQRGPETPQELFNHRHSSLRNCIERSFGVLKKRFRIIASGAECQYSTTTMSQIVLACCVLHNFILSVDRDDIFLGQEELGLDEEITDKNNSEEFAASRSEDARMEYIKGYKLRELIAEQMWAAYQL